jgi:itaconate CoA-transferase
VTTLGDARPLDGVVVVSLEQAVAAPFATRQLADLGATVIKVERPEGDFARHYDSHVHGSSAFFVWANRGKHSVVLDVKDPGQRERFDALIASADVFVHNVSPSAARRLGVDAESLQQRLPHLVVCDVSGYGEGGPRSGDKAYDLAIQAESGAFAVTGDDAMSKVGFSVADISAGMYAFAGILAALFARERTGVAPSVPVVMLESLTEWLSAPLYAAVYGPGRPQRTGRRHHAIAPYGTFPLADGRTLLIAVQSDGEWQRLARVGLRRDDLADDPTLATNEQRIAHVARLEAEMGQALLSVPADEALRRLAEASIAVARVNDLDDVWQHEQLRGRERFHEVRIPGGTAEMLSSPFGGSVEGAWVPDLDEHDADLVAQLVERGRDRLHAPAR